MGPRRDFKQNPSRSHQFSFNMPTSSFWITITATCLLVCLKLSDSYVLPEPVDENSSSVVLQSNVDLVPIATSESENKSEEKTNSRHKRSVFSVPVKPPTSSDCPEGSRRTETGECVEAAPEIKGGGDKFLIDSLKNFYRTTTRKPPRRRRTTTTTPIPPDSETPSEQNELTTIQTTDPSPTLPSPTEQPEENITITTTITSDLSD